MPHSMRYRVMMSEKPSTHCPNEPETPAMLYPRGGISVCLRRYQLTSLAGGQGKQQA